MSNQLSPIEIARPVPMVQYYEDPYNEIMQSRTTDIRKLSCGTGTKNGTMASGASDTEEVDSD